MHAREFRDQGYTVVRGFFSKQDVSDLLEEIERRRASEDVEDALTNGGLIFTANVFKHSEKVRKIIAQQRVVDFLRPIVGGDLWVRWDQAVAKRPGAGVFRWHQDNGYNQLRTEHYQLWVALTETRNQNGALWLAPGSHKRGLLPHARVSHSQMEVQADVGQTVCVDATAGDLILFSSLMLHRTGPNEADTTRVAYVAEYMPLSDYDFDLKGKGPYFVAARNGQSCPHFTEEQPGARSIRNQLMYWRPQLDQAIYKAKQPLRALRDAVRARF